MNPGSTMLDGTQNIYDIQVEIFSNVSISDPNMFQRDTIPLKNIVRYNITRDSINFSHNMHYLTLYTMTQKAVQSLQKDDTELQITILENSNIISSKRFKIVYVNILNEKDYVYNIQLVLVSKLAYTFLNSYEYANTTSLSSTGINDVSPFEMLTYIVTDMQKNNTNLKCIMNDAGKINELFTTLRIPTSCNNIKLFNYLITSFTPYLLQPYIILDDSMYCTDPRNYFNNNEYCIVVNNLCGISKYPHKNINSIVGFNTKPKHQLSVEPIINDTELKTLLGSAIILKNPETSEIKILEPEKENRKNGKAVTIETFFGIETYKAFLLTRKKLTESNGNLLKYRFQKLNFGDIVFGMVYNMSLQSEYRDLPVQIYHDFVKNSYDGFYMEMDVTFASVPNNLI